MASLAPVAPKLQKIIPRLGTDSEGEQLATVAALARTLRSAGCDFNDLANALGPTPAPLGKSASEPRHYTAEEYDRADWRAMVDACLARREELNAKELDFLSSMRRWRGRPTTKQRRWLERIYAVLYGAPT